MAAPVDRGRRLNFRSKFEMLRTVAISIRIYRPAFLNGWAAAVWRLRLDGEGAVGA